MYANDPEFWCKKMNKKNMDQIKGYSRLIVRELHDVVMDEAVYEKMKMVLFLAEELECYMMSLDQKIETHAGASNIVQFRRLA